jgi:hypothetical protein
MAGFAEEQIARTLFRPRFVDGGLVTTPGSYTWSFRYDPEVAEMVGLVPTEEDPQAAASPAAPMADPLAAPAAFPETAPN